MHDLDRTQMESFEYDFESDFEAGNGGGVFSEAEVMNLASELMEVNSEQELEQFLGDLIKKAGRAVGKFIKSPTGNALGGILKSAAKQALPVVGSALGGLAGGEGAQIGSTLAGMASDRLGLELESEDEYETAKSFVRMAGDAVNLAAGAPNANPAAAVAQAARTHLPNVISAAASMSGAKQGRWIRRGNRIILLGV